MHEIKRNFIRCSGTRRFAARPSIKLLITNRLYLLAAPVPDPRIADDNNHLHKLRAVPSGLIGTVFASVLDQ